LREHFSESFQKYGVAPERLIFAGKDFPTKEHFQAYNRVAIALDPWPYNGTTTTFDALWMGTPVITLRGDRHAARVGGTILEALGCPELIAESEEEYLEKAVVLATDPERLRHYHHRLRQQLQDSPLMQAETFAAAFSRCLETAWHDWSSTQLEIHQRLLREWGIQMGLPQPTATCEQLAVNPQLQEILRATVARQAEARPYLKVGQAYFNEGNYPKARAAFALALSLEPDNPIIRFTLAIALQNQQRQDEALLHHLQAFSADPGLTGAAVNAGRLLMEQKAYQQAQEILLKAARQAPNDADLNFQLASAYYHLGHAKKAYQALVRCLKLNPRQAGLWNNLGHLMHETGKPDEAIDCFRRALEVDPELDEAHTNLLWNLAQICVWEELKERQQAAGRIAPLLSLILFADPHRNLQDAQKACARNYREREIMLQPPSPDVSANEPVRIGYLSCDFRDHPVAHNLVNLFRLHDRERFHVTVYSCGEDHRRHFRRLRRRY
jgi:predicted O-linked N-acetylglucosamine transferase (SPINDLY family)